MEVNEIFKGIQGEGRYVGFPAIFVRLAGCNKKCKFCDTDYSCNTVLTPGELNEEVNNFDSGLVIWTGGEPMLQYDEIMEVIRNSAKIHHIETNGSIIKEMNAFDYTCFSPKNLHDIINIKENKKEVCGTDYDIKVVTDLETTGIEMLRYATMIMPLTTFNKKNDLEIKKRVWKYCIENGKRYCPRLHVDVWGNKRGT